MNETPEGIALEAYTKGDQLITVWDAGNAQIEGAEILRIDRSVDGHIWENLGLMRYTPNGYIATLTPPPDDYQIRILAQNDDGKVLAHSSVALVIRD